MEASPRLCIALPATPGAVIASQTAGTLWPQISYDMADSAAGLPRLWSAETPHLYLLVVSLVGADGAHIESESCQASVAIRILQLTLHTY